MKQHDEFKWHYRFLDLADHIAGWSKDRSTKIGCVIVGPHKQICAMGYNGFPRGANDDVAKRHDRPLKYRWTEHAERNAIYNASLTGISLYGCTLFVNACPCMDCTRAIVQCGISTVVIRHLAPTKDFYERWKHDIFLTRQLFKEACVDLEIMKGKET